MAQNTLPPSVNYHLLQPCNMRCRHCFATFPDVDGRLSREHSIALVQRLAEAGVEKLTFAGGEPMLCPWLPELVRAAKQAGMTTMMVTNGSRLDAAPWILGHERLLDWVALSVDSASEETHRAMGRAEHDVAIPAGQYVRLAAQLRSAGIRMKVNTVVTALNADEDMAAFVRDLAPERWNVLRVLPVRGQNDGKVEPLLVTASQFAAFLSRHSGLATDGIEIVGEDHEDIVGGYAMIDPLGRFFDDTKGHHTYSQPILDVGVHEAFAQVTGHVLDAPLHRPRRRLPVDRRTAPAAECAPGCPGRGVGQRQGHGRGTPQDARVHAGRGCRSDQASHAAGVRSHRRAAVGIRARRRRAAAGLHAARGVPAVRRRLPGDRGRCLAPALAT